MKSALILGFTLFMLEAWAIDLPSKHTSLLPYVQPGPDQGETATCLFMASTGAMELLANRAHGIKNPEEGGPFDLSEPYLIHQEEASLVNKHYFEYPIQAFRGKGVHVSQWPFKAWVNKKDEIIDWSSWQWRDSSEMKKIDLPKVKTQKLFAYGNKYATNVIDMEEINMIREALVTHNAPILVNYIDDSYWHVILIVGYDDKKDGICYEVDKTECTKTKGAFYVRDSDGLGVKLRDYDWFIQQGNAAFIVEEDGPVGTHLAPPSSQSLSRGNNATERNPHRGRRSIDKRDLSTGTRVSRIPSPARRARSSGAGKTSRTHSR